MVKVCAKTCTTGFLLQYLPCFWKTLVASKSAILGEMVVFVSVTFLLNGIGATLCLVEIITF